MSAPGKKRYQLLICDGPSCGVMHESELLKERLEREIEGDQALKERVTICDYTCFGRCDDGPNMFVHVLAEGEDGYDEPDPDVFDDERGFYPGLDEGKCLRILRTHVTEDRPVEDLVDEY